ncbi:alpha/beta hydrolase family protein [Aquabacterium sp. J223]|uniref:alpha/beta hydrolase family protein n=1 Tax=Aquabacterium sp. J223 TaxID=2898431 RepID=UPI0021ADEADC|nr:alpha/beta fold hydrolase [Aquabacterium sp. J223]UUX94228.1 alpha/beta fold hydrolase [Aquabacterium sp. J223]
MVAFIQVACKAGEAVVVPVQVTVQGSLKELKLEAFIYKPTGDGNFPVVIFNHGSSGGDPKRSFPSRVQAKHFAERGFVVIVPMRRGRGKSEGLSLESEEKNCDTQSWLPGLNAALEDVTAVIDYARRLPYADSSRIVLAGASRGGFLSVAYAAKGLKNAGIVGGDQFFGGLGGAGPRQLPNRF